MGKENTPQTMQKSTHKKLVHKAMTSKTQQRLRKLKKFERITPADKETRGVIYVGHLPYGFEESGLKTFFAQFGKITRIKMPRSEKVINSIIPIYIIRLQDQKAMLSSNLRNAILLKQQLKR